MSDSKLKQQVFDEKTLRDLRKLLKRLIPILNEHHVGDCCDRKANVSISDLDAVAFASITAAFDDMIDRGGSFGQSFGVPFSLAVDVKAGKIVWMLTLSALSRPLIVGDEAKRLLSFANVAQRQKGGEN